VTEVRENILKDAEKYLKLMVENSLDLITALDIEGKVIYISPSVNNMMGYKQEEVIGKTVFDFVNPDDLDEAKKAVIRSIKNPGSIELTELRFRHKNRSWIVLSSRGIVSVSLSGTTIIINSRDVTKDKKEEDELRKSKVMLQNIIDLLPVRIFWKDLSLKYLGCNLAFAKDAGKTSPIELIGKDDFQMGWRQQADLYRQDDMKVINSGTKKMEYEEEQTSPTGEKKWLSTSKMPLIDESGKIRGVLGAYMDITLRKNLENQVLEDKQEQEGILDAIPAWIFYKDTNNRFIRVNQAFADGMETTKKNLEGLPMEEVFPKEEAEKFFADDKEVIQSGKPKLNILEKVSSPQGLRWFQTDKIPYKDKVGKIVGVLGFALDVTERQKIEETESENLIELKKFKELMVGREMRMIELKEKIVELEAKLGLTGREEGEKKEKT
jgi:PAS domain S-box-containing protein